MSTCERGVVTQFTNGFEAVIFCELRFVVARRLTGLVILIPECFHSLVWVFTTTPSITTRPRGVAFVRHTIVLNKIRCFVDYIYHYSTSLFKSSILLSKATIVDMMCAISSGVGSNMRTSSL